MRIDGLRGAYEIGLPLARGHTAIVYHAWRVADGLRCVAKLGDPTVHASFDVVREHLLREARALAQLDHPAIPRLVDVTDAGLMLEYRAGTALEWHGAALDPAAAGALIRQVAAALDHVHARGLAYCDLHPRNVMCDAAGAVSLVDFGRCEPGAPDADHRALAALHIRLLTGLPCWAPDYPPDYVATLNPAVSLESSAALVAAYAGTHDAVQRGRQGACAAPQVQSP